MSLQTAGQANKNSKYNVYIVAWVIGLLFYFVEYAVRSSPSVMMPEMAGFFGTSTVGMSAMVGTYYYTYSVTSLIAGIALDKAGAKYAVSIGIFILALGCLLFAVSNIFTGNVARMLQGAGSAFAFLGCVYLASKGFRHGCWQPPLVSRSAWACWAARPGNGRLVR